MRFPPLLLYLIFNLCYLRTSIKVIIFVNDPILSALSLTKLYDLLSIKVGKETAENLTTYIEEKVKDEVYYKSQMLATRDDIGELKNEMVAGFAGLRKEMVNSIAELRNEMVAGFTELRKEIAVMNADLRKDMFVMETDLRKEIADVRENAASTKSDIIKWMFIFWIGQVATTFALILLFIKK